MITDVVIVGSFAMMLVILASILGAIERRERYAFVLGIFLFIVGHSLITSPELVGVGLAVFGIALAGASALPMLRESA